MANQINLTVNDRPVELNPFVQSFIEHVATGILSALHGTGAIENMALAITADKQVTIRLNNALVPLSPFVSKIIYGTITGMVAALKDVGQINNLQIVIKAENTPSD